MVEQPSRIKRMFWYFTPVQSSVIVQATDTIVAAETYPSTRLSNLGHVLYALFWISAVAAYSIFVTYQHFTKPDAKNFMHEPAQEHPMVNVSVFAWCSRPGQCGDISVSVDYRNAPTWCRSAPQINKVYDVNTGMTETISVPLCFTSEHVFSTLNDAPMPPELGVIIDFRDICAVPPCAGTATPYPWRLEEKPAEAKRDFAAQDHHAKSSGSTGAVRITGPGDLNRTINIETWQVKTVMMGQSVTYDDKMWQESVAYPLAIQYEGRRPSRRATMILNLAPYADVTRIETKKGDTTFVGWMTLLGTMCGMAFFMNSLQCFFEPFFIWVFPGPAELARRIKAKQEKQDAENLQQGLLNDCGAGAAEELKMVQKAPAPVPPIQEQPAAAAAAQPTQQQAAEQPSLQAAASTTTAEPHSPQGAAPQAEHTTDGELQHL